MKRLLLLAWAAPLVAACSSDPAPGAPDATVDASADVVTDDIAPDAPRMRVVPTEWPRTPPAFPTYSRGRCPTLRGGNTLDTTLNGDFASGTHSRRFRLVVPPGYDPSGTDRWPVIFAWHWLAGSSEEMIREGEIFTSAERQRMIVVVPDQLVVNGQQVNGFVWPFVDPTMAEPELQFFDDMLACVSQQYRVDPARVHGLGVSAGALWLTYLSTTTRAAHLASAAILSGGLGEALGAWQMSYVPQPNKFPALVLWGGVRDRLVIDFDAASKRLRDALLDDGHFVLTCTHDMGHAIPPFMPPPGESRFTFLWDFFARHPYGLPPATSPYLRDGLPASSPPWCGIPPEILADGPRDF